MLLHTGSDTVRSLVVLVDNMYTLRQEILPPSGVEYFASLKLTPATVTAPGFSTLLDGPSRRDFTSRSICNLVVARSNLLRIFEVREELASIPFDDDSGKRSRMRRGTEAVEGEVEMDEQGEGFVNMGAVKVIFFEYVRPLSFKDPVFLQCDIVSQRCWSCRKLY